MVSQLLDHANSPRPNIPQDFLRFNGFPSTDSRHFHEVPTSFALSNLPDPSSAGTRIFLLNFIHLCEIDSIERIREGGLGDGFGLLEGNEQITLR